MKSQKTPKRPEPRMVDGFPRRRRVDLSTPEEKAIREAISKVEAAGAHPWMTEAVTLLTEALERVADYVELKWDRIRFKANLEDYRPVIWPPLGPYWCSGFNDTHSIVVAYVPAGLPDDQIRRFWPEVGEIYRMQIGVSLQFSDRFPKPDWWNQEPAGVGDSGYCGEHV